MLGDFSCLDNDTSSSAGGTYRLMDAQGHLLYVPHICLPIIFFLIRYLHSKQMPMATAPTPHP